MKTINKGFERLRQVVPYARDDRRHSKVETLRMAIEYIRKQFNLSPFHFKPNSFQALFMFFFSFLAHFSFMQLKNCEIEIWTIC